MSCVSLHACTRRILRSLDTQHTILRLSVLGYVGSKTICRKLKSISRGWMASASKQVLNCNSIMCVCVCVCQFRAIISSDFHRMGRGVLVDPKPKSNLQISTRIESYWKKHPTLEMNPKWLVLMRWCETDKWRAKRTDFEVNIQNIKSTSW